MWSAEVQVAEQRYREFLREAEEVNAWKAARGITANRNAGLNNQLQRTWRGVRRIVGQTVIRTGQFVAGPTLQREQIH